MNNSAITFVMLAHESSTSSRYLVRALTFYREFNMHILLVDGAIESRLQLVRDVGNPEIEYFHHPNQAAWERLQFGFEHVHTPYIKFLSIDDFFIPSGIDACISFLDNNPTYATAWGTSICFQENLFNLDYFLLDNWARVYDCISEDPLERIQYFWENCSYQCPYGVFRLEAYNLSLQALKLGPASFNLHELVNLTSIAAFGKTHRLNVPFAVKESRPNSESKNTIMLHELIHMEEHTDKLKQFHSSLHSLACMYPPQPPLPASECANKIFQSILNWYSKTLHQKWTYPRLFSSTWDNTQKAPIFRFEQIQYIDCGLYTPSFFAQLHKIDFSIRAHGICEEAGYKSLDESIYKISTLVDMGNLLEAEQLLISIYKLTPFHRKTLALLKRVYTYLGQLNIVLQINAWEQKIQKEVYFPLISDS